MRLVFFGTPQFAVPSLGAVLDAGHSVVGVVTQPDRPQGRGHAILAPPVKVFASSRGLKVFQPSGIRHTEFLKEISELAPEVIVVVAYGKILPPSLLALPPLGCINVHASLLPKYRGAAPVQRALMNGEESTGVTTMFMSEGLDEGDILLQETVIISDSDTSETLFGKLSVTGSTLLVKTLLGIGAGTLKRTPQEGEPSYAPPLSKDDGLIRWSSPAKGIFDQIRATQPWPGAHARINGERIMVLRAAYRSGFQQVTPGTVVEVSRDSISVGTGEGILHILEVKPEGKKAMAAAAFAHGRKIREGVSFDEA